MKKIYVLVLMILSCFIFGCTNNEVKYYSVDVDYNEDYGNVLIVGTMNSENKYRGDIEIRITPKEGYQILFVYIENGEELLSDNSIYTINQISEDSVVIVEFYSIKNPTEPIIPTEQYYSVNIEYDKEKGNVQISGSMNSEGKYKGIVEIKISANPGYKYLYVQNKNDNSIFIYSESYLINGINKDYNLVVCFEEDQLTPTDELIFLYEGSYYNDIDLSLTGNSMKSALRSLITSTHKHKTTYNEIRDLFKKSDEDLNKPGNLILFYSNVSINGAWVGDSVWNREHIWPKSLGWFDTSGAGSDLHHIRPTDTDINGRRGNLPFGEVNGGSELYTMSVNGNVASGCYIGGGYFEPADRIKGDTARILFYLLTRYSESDSYSITRVAQSMDMLLRWNRLDPVDEWELNRNNQVYEIQGNRNPFIDCSGLADIIWG